MNFIGSFFYYLCFWKRFNLWLRWFLKYVVFINLRRELIIIIIASIFDTHFNARKGPCIAFILRIFGSHYHNNSNPWKINWYDRSDEILEEKFTYKFLFKSALLDSFSAYFFVLNSRYFCHGFFRFRIKLLLIIERWWKPVSIRYGGILDLFLRYKFIKCRRDSWGNLYSIRNAATRKKPHCFIKIIKLPTKR